MQRPDFVIYVFWFVWFLCWAAASVGRARHGKRLGLGQEIVFRVLATFGTLLLFVSPLPGFDVQYQFWRPLNGTGGWALLMVVLLGFVFAGWGRVQLGWSSDPTRTEELRVVESGPFRFVRQPIYLGVIVAAFATAMLFGRPTSLTGAAVLTLAFAIKIVMEESLMRSETGSYDDYAERVPMLVPFLTAKPWGERYTPPGAPTLPRATEEPPVSIVPSSPALAAAPVAAAAGTQMSLPLAAPMTMVQAEPAAQPAPASKTTADESVAPEADEAPAQPELSEAMSITKR